MDIILASVSPRRAELLARLGLPFRVIAPDCDETLPRGIAPARAVVLLAQQKAQAAAPKAPNCLIIAADTVVVLGREILGKPADAEGAKNMLRRLSGKSHCVYTGVCLLVGDKKDVFAEKTKVWFEEIPEADLEKLALDGLDKAGAYGIQGLAGAYVTRIVGSYDNVVGLPLAVVRTKVSKLSADCAV